MQATAARPQAAVWDTVGVTHRGFADSARSGWDGTGARPLRTLVWYPSGTSRPQESGDDARRQAGAPRRKATVSNDRTRYPLVLLSHGAMGAAERMSWLGTELAAHGFLAAAVSHLGRSCDELRLASRFYLSDWLLWERAADVSAVLTAALADPVIGPRIDRDRVGVAGFSAGGTTALLLAGGRLDLRRLQAHLGVPEDLEGALPQAIAEFEQLKQTNARVRDSAARSGESFRDGRIGCAFALSPAMGQGFTEEGLGQVSVPVRIVAGRDDVVTPVAVNAQRFAQFIPHVELTVIPGGAGHWVGEPEDERAHVLHQISRMALGFFAATMR